ncbi:hypothetical protein [Blastopirellula marina]|uniref:Uncharacterized protein n=1 Tax=Blastopirellula marina DSM 3645 TaxID=314230 RepID=A3ZSA0_9BACT|nr:hypothetical protein [Blastopirellula marina]EAQ80558.1 hypothetical protein DSM3645_14470 [Blastopirellula marina DSM 3645]
MSKDDVRKNEGEEMVALNRLAYQLGKMVSRLPEVGSLIVLFLIIVIGQFLGIISPLIGWIVITVSAVLLCFNFFLRRWRRSKAGPQADMAEFKELIIPGESSPESLVHVASKPRSRGDGGLAAAFADFYRAYPFASLGGILLLLVTLGVFFDLLETSVAFAIFLFGAMFLVALNVFGQLLKLPPLVLVFVVIVGASVKSCNDRARDRQHRAAVSMAMNHQPLAGHGQRQKAKSTEAYWQATVSSRHLFRFGPPLPPVQNQVDFDRLIHTMRKNVRETREATNDNLDVDLDLVALSQRLLSTDELELQWAEDTAKFLNFGNADESLPSYEDALNQLNEMTEEQRQQLPPEVQACLSDLFTLMETRQSLSSEVEAIQATLRNRYPTQRFPLPELESNSEDPAQ